MCVCVKERGKAGEGTIVYHSYNVRENFHSVTSNYKLLERVNVSFVNTLNMVTDLRIAAV